MRRLIAFECEGDLLAGSLDLAPGRTGVLIVTGGTQTRIGSHRMFERLAHGLAAAGYPCFRFDRRGVGDSDGTDPDFRGNAADMQAAAAIFRSAAPDMAQLIGLGLCDGATSLALHGASAQLGGVILINPWLIEAEADAPPPAAIRHHYRQRLLSVDGWKKILTGSLSYRKLFKGILTLAGPEHPSALADDVAAGLAASSVRIELILASGDGTAIAAADAWKAHPFPSLPSQVAAIDTDSHTFSRPGDRAALHQAVVTALERLGGSGRD